MKKYYIAPGAQVITVELFQLLAGSKIEDIEHMNEEYCNLMALTLHGGPLRVGLLHLFSSVTAGPMPRASSRFLR